MVDDVIEVTEDAVATTSESASSTLGKRLRRRTKRNRRWRSPKTKRVELTLDTASETRDVGSLAWCNALRSSPFPFLRCISILWFWACQHFGNILRSEVREDDSVQDLSGYLTRSDEPVTEEGPGRDRVRGDSLPLTMAVEPKSRYREEETWDLCAVEARDLLDVAVPEK